MALRENYILEVRPGGCSPISLLRTQLTKLQRATKLESIIFEFYYFYVMNIEIIYKIILLKVLINLLP